MSPEEERSIEASDLEEVEDLEAPAELQMDVVGGKAKKGCSCSNGTSPQCPDPQATE